MGRQRAPPAGQLQHRRGDGGVRQPAGAVGARQTVPDREAPSERVTEHLPTGIPRDFAHHMNPTCTNEIVMFKYVWNNPILLLTGAGGQICEMSENMKRTNS